MSRSFLQIAVGLAPLPTGERLVRFIGWGRRAHILGQLATVWEERADGKLAEILANARIWAGHDRRMLSYEMNRITRALMGTDIYPVLLKGGAYVAKALTAGEGRRVSDIDILVKEDELDRVEASLKDAGWVADEGTSGDYDQQYYRAWMHELPPLRHKSRRTVVDVHHRLTPRTARLKVDHEAMFAAARPTADSALKVFNPTDRFIHAAIHICADGAFETPERSLIELFYLFADLSEAEAEGLRARAAEVGALWPVDHALWAISWFFANKRARSLCREGMFAKAFAAPVRWAIRAKVAGGLRAKAAMLLLYPRSHLLRMPIGMLTVHLFRKAVRSLSGSQAN
ncbi:nucleotidyltransferase family protein [Kordiimonas marina]|uniref:nucleotidyltransferase family protein n=1 Tax=Kordiimonas marina TaxID=2872312 RepID=UPI001FF3E3D5|nr:nucleotidyltransferase family protein [Kordiimonas marina]MCJ9430381.1 nucleotidyltransferase family protein [Kordiimonas marina]